MQRVATKLDARDQRRRNELGAENPVKMCDEGCTLDADYLF